MTETKNQIDYSEANQSQGTHNFHVLTPDSRRQIIETKVPIQDSGEEIYKKENITEGKERLSSNQSILGAAFLLTNMCLGTTIFTFGSRAKEIGLIWLIVFCFVVAAVDYWSIMNGCVASSKVDVDDYSEITEKIIGKKSRVLLNIIIIVYSYGVMITFYVLIFALFGRFIQSVGYREYTTYSEFVADKWGKAYIKYPFCLGMAVFLSLMSLIKDIQKLNFTAYIGVAAVIYSLFVVMIQCNTYYNYYKENVYIEEDKSTHLNLVDLGQGFTKDLNFFKTLACIYGAYACHTGIFPVFAGFKYQENGVKKMKFSVFYSMCLTTALHIISVVCSYLTDPYTPEDVIIYRKSIDNGKDIAMTISKLFITLSLVFTSPGYFFGLRLSVANSFTGGKISKLFNILFTFISMFVCAIIAALYDKILNYASYIGGFITVFVAYLYPALLHIYSSGKPFTYWRNLLDLIIAIILCAIGIIAGIRTIIDDVQNV